jgi:hypothetical protein
VCFCLTACAFPLSCAQLGHGTDHEYNSKEGTVKLAYSPQAVPTVVRTLKAAGAKVTKIACGHNHCVAVDAAGKVWTWGNGGYGRLGHKEQKDEFLPKQVVIPGGDRNVCPPDCVVAAVRGFCCLRCAALLPNSGADARSCLFFFLRFAGRHLLLRVRGAGAALLLGQGTHHALQHASQAA